MHITTKNKSKLDLQVEYTYKSIYFYIYIDGKCLDLLWWFYYYDNQKVIEREYTGTDAQQWYLKYIDDTSKNYIIKRNFIGTPYYLCYNNDKYYISSSNNYAVTLHNAYSK
jgi:hypothetical protein